MSLQTAKQTIMWFVYLPWSCWNW